MTGQMHGVYYTDGGFYLRVENDDAATDGRDAATHLEGWKNGQMLWRVEKNVHPHEQALELHAEITGVCVLRA